MRKGKMITDVIAVLQALGVYPVIGFIGVTVAAIFIYRYFTDR